MVIVWHIIPLLKVAGVFLLNPKEVRCVLRAVHSKEDYTSGNLYYENTKINIACEVFIAILCYVHLAIRRYLSLPILPFKYYTNFQLLNCF